MMGAHWEPRMESSPRLGGDGDDKSLFLPPEADVMLYDKQMSALGLSGSSLK